MRAVKAVFAVIGLVMVLWVGAQLAFPWLWSSPQESFAREFATPEALADLDRLYSRLEQSPHDAALGPAHGDPGAAKVRRLPRSWMPARFVTRGSHELSTGPLFSPGETRVHYDADDRLVAIEFGGRATCWVSRHRTSLPSQFVALHRLAEKPLFVTVRIVFDEKRSR